MAFLVAFGFTTILAYRTVRELVVSWQISGEERETLQLEENDLIEPLTDENQTPFDPSQPLQLFDGPPAEPWDGTSRITILVMGLDFRDWEAGNGPPRTDTMILMTLDPLSKTAGMLSIPRDLWVSIPGFESGKINTAYQLGEAFDFPGGGPGLAVQTVEQLLGISINYYAQVDFVAFVHLIDEIGGVKIDIPEEIEVDPIGVGNIKTLKPGVQTLPGNVALAYARARNTVGGDFDRAQRQQQVILGVKDRILSFDLIPVLIAKAPVLYGEISSGINTNMSFEQIIRLGLLSQQIPEENIARRVLNGDFVTFDRSPEGLDILKPIPDKIRLLRDEVFVATSSVSPVSVNKSIEELISEEKANISILNGTFTPGLASRTTELLQSKGLNIINTDNATQLHEATVIIDYTGKPYTLQYLVDLMDISASRILHSYDPESQVDIEIALGNDWASSEVLP
jgi:LCP family protein required for cell wall assembly